ncbi:hypothetical protein HC891_28075 [Candidatus Gracilibacteria bacterium]|nr:hypothetical protein [Candidatus Gracilibacteria bacterium]
MARPGRCATAVKQCRPCIAKAEKELLVFRSGDRDVLVSYLLDGQRTCSLEQAEGVVGALLELPGNGHWPHALPPDARRCRPTIWSRPTL